jgi:glycerol-3-phosphate dehydrogenase subunit C
VNAIFSAPEKKISAVIEACADCEQCRHMMASECLFFDALYRLHDQAKENGQPLATGDLRDLVGLCNYCALCSCPDIRAGIIEAKARFVERDGLTLGSRLLEDVARTGKLCGLFPHLTNRMLANDKTGRLLKRVAGIHEDRRLPTFPEASFDTWARRQGLMHKPAPGAVNRVAYFAGCSGRYLFPEVPQALVQVYQHAGIQLYFPDQQCCGMPTLLEGDRKKTLAFMAANVERLAALVAEGFTIVCSCPTCGFVLKKLLKERAYYADAYQMSVGAEEGILKVPVEGLTSQGGGPVFNHIRKSIYGKILKDDGYFAAIDPLSRIAVAENTMDAGEYLLKLFRGDQGRVGFKPLTQRLVYFAPCHQREQNMGRPYMELLQLLRGPAIGVVDGTYDCCGMGGIMGYQRRFHAHAIRLGTPVMEKITDRRPDAIVTECLSCRLQFMHLADTPVAHPLEVMAALLDEARG